MVTYNLDIPDGPNNPSNDQPKMKTNTNSIQTLISVDHVGFNTSGSPPNGVGGHHLQVSFDGKNVPAAQTDPQSVLYTNNVIAGAFNTASASTVAEMFYRNQSGTLPVSMIKAFGSFSGGGTSLNSYNLTATKTGTGIYQMDMPVNIITQSGANYIVIPATGITGLNPGRGAVYQIVSATQFEFGFRNFTTNALADPDYFSVLVLQL